MIKSGEEIIYKIFKQPVQQLRLNLLIHRFLRGQNLLAETDFEKERDVDALLNLLDQDLTRNENRQKLKLYEKSLKKYCPVETVPKNIKKIVFVAFSLENVTYANQPIVSRYNENFLNSNCIINIKNFSGFYSHFLKNYITINLFNDFYEDVLVNLESFVYSYKKGLLKKSERNDRLQRFYNLLSSKDGEIFSADLSKFVGIKEDLYDVFKEMQQVAFNSIKESLYLPKQEDLDQRRTERFGVKVYNIGSSQKKLLLHVTSFSRKWRRNSPEKLKVFRGKGPVSIKHSILPERGRRGKANDFISLSYVDNSDLKTFRDIGHFVCLVYGNNIPNDHLITISNMDAFTERSHTAEGAVFSDQKPFYSSADDLLDATKYFNEIAIIKRDDFGEKAGKPNLPIAVFCNGFITEEDVRCARRFNVPIIFSETYKNMECEGYSFEGMVYFYDSDCIESEAVL